jgi:hypothetical protein
MADETEETDPGSVSSSESYPANIGELKDKLDQFDNDQAIVGHTTDGDGNYFLHPVDVVKMPGNNDKVLIDLTPTKVAE